MSWNWLQIDSGATFHALIGALIQSDDHRAKVLARLGPDGGIDAFSVDCKTVYQSKHHRSGTGAGACADAYAELEEIRRHRQSQRWRHLWRDVTSWKLITNVAFGAADEGR